jgi:hypothetical protein
MAQTLKKLKRYIGKRKAAPARFNFVTFLTNQFSRSRFWFRFGKTDDFLVFFPLAALLQELDPLEALQHIAPGGDRAGSFETAML